MSEVKIDKFDAETLQKVLDGEVNIYDINCFWTEIFFVIANFLGSISKNDYPKILANSNLQFSQSLCTDIAVRKGFWEHLVSNIEVDKYFDEFRAVLKEVSVEDEELAKLLEGINPLENSVFQFAKKLKYLDSAISYLIYEMTYDSEIPNMLILWLKNGKVIFLNEEFVDDPYEDTDTSGVINLRHYFSKIEPTPKVNPKGLLAIAEYLYSIK